MRVCQWVKNGFSAVYATILIGIVGVSCVWAVPSDRSNLCNPVLRITALPEAPKLDGIRESLWDSAARLTLYNSKTGDIPQKRTIAWVGYGEDGFYVFAQCQDHAVDKLAARISHHDGNVWEDDCVELFWGKEDEDICHLIVNSRGVLFDERSYQGSLWNSHAQVANVVSDNGWTAEIFIPSSSLNDGPLAAGQRYQFNLAREEKELNELTDFSVVGADFLDKRYYGTLVLVETLPDTFEGEVHGSVQDGHGTPVSQARICWGSMIVLSDSQGRFSLKGPAQGSKEPVTCWKPGYILSEQIVEAGEALSFTLVKKGLYSLQFAPDFKSDETYRVISVSPEAVVTGDYAVPDAIWTEALEPRTFAAQGQTAALTFVLYSKKDLGSVDFHVTRFDSASGAALPEADVRLVRMRTRRDRYVSTLPSEPIPEILDPVHPVTIDENSFRQVWIMMEPSMDTPPGIYRGSLEVIPEKGPATRIPISLRVLPFRLIEPSHKMVGAFYYGRRGNWWRFNPGTTFSHYESEFEDMARHGVRSVFFCDTPEFVKRKNGQLVVYSGFERAEPADERFEEKYAFLAEGEVAIDLERFMWVIDKFHDYGITGPLIQFQSLKNPAAAAASDTSLSDVRAHGPGAVGPEFIELFSKAIKDINAAVSARGYAPIYFSVTDEINWGGEHRMTGFMKLAEIVKAAGGCQSITLSLQMAENELAQVRTVVDMPVGSGPYTLVKKQNTGHWQGRISEYCQVWSRDFLFQRRRAGVWLWYFPHYGHYAHCYQGYVDDPFNDFDGPTTDMCAAYPDPKTGEPIPTLHWEGFREGFYDLCYLNTLEQRLNELSGGDSRGICEEAQRQVAAIIERYVDKNGDLDGLGDISAQEIHEIRLIIADALVRSYGEQGLRDWMRKGF